MTRSWTVVAVLLALVLTVSCGNHTGTVSVLNKAEEPIAHATLKMSWGERFEVTDVNPSKTAVINYRVREGDYQVEVVFQSGKRLETDHYYLASSVDYQDQITVTASEIQVVHTPIASR